MRILVLGINSWDTRNAVGNSLSNWFDGWNDCEFAFMYTRSAPPNNTCCRKYYQVNFFDIIRNLFTPEKIGTPFTGSSKSFPAGAGVETSVVYRSSGKLRDVIKKIVELAYSTGIWFNRKTKNYIREFNPDIVFTFILGDAFRYKILKFIKAETNAKMVEFVADDIWNQMNHTVSLYASVQRRRVTAEFEMADAIYGASKKLCDKYRALFNVEISPLYKGARINSVKESVNHPIRLVYAGNLHYGRDLILSRLADAIAKINREKIVAKLEIYSNSYISDEVNEKLNKPGDGCQLFGVRPYEEIKEIMSASDIVLHVESFRKEDIVLAKYSFSTKIIDCLQSGSVMMAIGPEDNASIEYAKSIPGTLVLTDLSTIEETLSHYLDCPDKLCENARKINDYAERVHNLDVVRTKLRSEFEKLLNNY